MTVATAACRSCSTALENPQRCRACGEFQPHEPRRDHFATLGLPRRFVVDPAGLQQRMIAFSRDLHPDLAGTAPGVRARAVLGAAQVNEAYATLRDAHARGEYLLKLLGGPSASEDKSVPDGFLEAMLDERDAVDAALGAGAAEAAQLGARFAAELAAGDARLAAQFAELAALPPDAPAQARSVRFASLRRELNRMAYHRTLARDLRDGQIDKESA